MRPPHTTPCNECPWRRTSAAGWLGPLSADEWLWLAHGDEPIACHQTIEEDDVATDSMRHCTGAAIYRGNVCKSPRDPDIPTLAADREAVFSHRGEFVSHHERTP